MKKAAFILTILTLFIACMIVFGGCKTRTITNHTTETKTITIKERDTTFFYQGAQVQNGNDIDSITSYLQTMFKQGLNGIENKVQYKSADNKVALTFWLDKMGKLQADCSSKDSSYQATIKDITERFEKVENKTTTIKEKYIPTWLIVIFSIVGGIALLAIGLLVWILRKIKIEF